MKRQYWLGNFLKFGFLNTCSCKYHCFRSRFSRGSKESKESPRSGRRSEERDPGKGSPRSATRRERDKDSRDREKDASRNASKLTLDLQPSKDQQCLAPLQEQQSKISKVASLTPANKSSTTSSSGNYHGGASSMVQSGIPQAGTPGSPLAPGTGIPKPTAAVKGTAKSIVPPGSSMSQGSSSKEKNGRLPSSKSRNVAAPSIHNSSFDTKDMKGSLTRQKPMNTRTEDGRVTVALVSPMPAREQSSNTHNTNGNIPGYSNGNQVTASESASTLSEGSQNSFHSNSSGSSVIYKPTSSEDDVDFKIVNRHVSYHLRWWIRIFSLQ